MQGKIKSRHVLVGLLILVIVIVAGFFVPIGPPRMAPNAICSVGGAPAVTIRLTLIRGQTFKDIPNNPPIYPYIPPNPNHTIGGCMYTDQVKYALYLL
jgi:hypothetical protein